MLAVCTTVAELIPIFIAFGVGNSLCRPVMPAYLGSIAPKGHSAAYISLNSVFSNMSMMVFAQITLLFAVNQTAAFLLGGFCSILNCAILMYFAIYSLITKPAAAAAQAKVVVVDQNSKVFLLDYSTTCSLTN